MGDRVGYRIGAHGESSDVRRFEVATQNQLERHVTDKNLTFGTHRRGACIDVVVRTCSAGEGKRAEPHGTFYKKLLQASTMIHWRQSAPTLFGVRTEVNRVLRFSVGSACALMIAAFAAACGDDIPIGPNALRFGLSGRISIHLETPLRVDPGTLTPAGMLIQRLEWQSSGAWRVYERISYRGLTGDETLIRNSGDPFGFVGAYVQLITTVSSVEGLELDVPELPIGVTDECGPGRTRITFSITDLPRDSTSMWQQCADGSLSELRTVNAGPRPAAARLVQATLAARDATFGPDRLSAYNGSVPFGTLDRGEETLAMPAAPFVVLDDAAWSAFWLDHSGGTEPPEVNFDIEMVIVAAVGRRDEAGDSVEVRQILQVDNGTLAHLFERVPGDFCSPVARTHYPFHIVISPVTPTPIRFADINLEFVPCGG